MNRKSHSANSRYEEILDYPYRGPLRHPRMPLEKRGAQFAPFAALTGYDAVIRETALHTAEDMDPAVSAPLPEEC